MISFNLVCDQGHEFTLWFRSSADYDTQLERKLVRCPVCDSVHVTKALMAPSVQTSRKKARLTVEATGELDQPTPSPSQPPSAASHLPVPRLPQDAFSNLPADPEKVAHALRAFKQAVMAQAEYVGDKFAEEARRIHEEEEEPRGIYGEATPQEVEELEEDGIAVMPLPNLPEEQH